MRKLLITGITGLIGASVLRKLIEGNYLKKAPEPITFQVLAIVRPQTDFLRYRDFTSHIEFIELDLSDLKKLKDVLYDFKPDVIVHIGALRGGRKFSRDEFYATNVFSTETMIEYCLHTRAELLFCSSVGVFGAIPNELPANNQTERVPDNYYHYTKIEAEKKINRAVLNGLRAAILRPSITYGEGDHGFPETLVRLVHKHRLPLTRKRIWIHLCNIDTISSAFLWLLTNDFPNGLAANIADREPVQFRDLVNFVSRQLSNKNYPAFFEVDPKIFLYIERFMRFIKNELWISRIQLISKSWFFDVSSAYDLMGLPEHYTIPDFKITIHDYLDSQKQIKP